VATFTAKLAASERAPLRDFLERLGFEFRQAPHAHFAARGDGAHVTFYCSGKLVVQGKGADGVWDYLRAMGLVEGAAKTTGGAGGEPVADDETESRRRERVTRERPQRIGGDECGKGDYFGPLVVAACRWSSSTEKTLAGSGLQDSKRISDARIGPLAKLIRNATEFQVLSLKPETYNRLYSKIGNLNRMLAWAHARALEDLLELRPDTELAVIDKFANEKVLQKALLQRGRSIRLIQEVRAESDPAVAAASVLARDRFLNDLARLSEEIGVDLPKGATHVLPVARKIVAQQGRESLRRIAKLHFRTTERI
jgi:ribonuclease HIII